MYINHIGIYGDAAAIQAALNEGSLANPYVAVKDDTGEVDYNTLTPEEPCYLGEWSDNGAGTYTFQILESGDTAWNNAVNIGTLNGVYSDGNHDDLDIKFNYNQGSGTWHMVFFSEIASNTPEYDFEEGVTDAWESGVMTDPNDSDAVISVDWDGTDTFVFNTSGDLHPLSMTTINPECSEEGPIE